MHKIIYTKGSEQDLKEIHEYISMDNVLQANIVIDNITAFINVNLSIFPKLGVILNENLNIRTIVEQKYRYKVVYKVGVENIEIYAIFKYKKMSL